MVELLLAGSFSACMLSVARLSGNVRPRWHSQHTVARWYHHCLFMPYYVPGTRRKSVLVLLTFCLPHSMQHSKCCKDRSESVVSVTIQHVIFAGLSSAAVQRNPSWLRDAALVAHVVHQILLQLLRAVQMWRCIEDIKIRIGELVPLTTFALCFAIFWVIV